MLRLCPVIAREELEELEDGPSFPMPEAGDYGLLPIGELDGATEVYVYTPTRRMQKRALCRTRKAAIRWVLADQMAAGAQTRVWDVEEDGLPYVAEWRELELVRAELRKEGVW